jgi:hypothetical protein
MGIETIERGSYSREENICGNTVFKEVLTRWSQN